MSKNMFYNIDSEIVQQAAAQMSPIFENDNSCMMFDLCRKAKLDKPEFEMKSGCFVVTLWRKNVKKDKTEQVTDPEISYYE